MMTIKNISAGRCSDTIFVGFTAGHMDMEFELYNNGLSGTPYTDIRAWMTKNKIPVEYASVNGVRTGLIFEDEDAVAFRLAFL
jgi:hypothetical protein